MRLKRFYYFKGCNKKIGFEGENIKKPNTDIRLLFEKIENGGIKIFLED